MKPTDFDPPRAADPAAPTETGPPVGASSPGPAGRGAAAALGPGLLVALLVLLSRLPFLGHGYGADPDAWRAISASQDLVDTGRYVPSRVPGYPLPEYVDALMIHLGAGSSWGIGLLSALLSGAAAALFFHLLVPLGRARAVAGTLAMSFTPVVYVAGLGAMDYLWGLTFFLAATVCMRSNRVWPAAFFLGLAAASRPSYALGIIPLALLYADFDVRRFRRPEVLRQLAVLALASGLIALAFFLPAFLNVGVRSPERYGDWKYLAYNSTLGLFGVIGLVGVGCAVVSAWRNRRGGVPLTAPLGQRLDAWAVTVLAVFGLLFVWLPDEASYLIPALPGLYWLLCRYANQIALWAATVLSLLSCFLFSVDRSAGTAGFALRGPVIREVTVQNERTCVAAVVRRSLASSPDGLDYVIVGSYRPQLLVELGPPLSGRLLYTVRPDGDRRLVDTEGVVFPDDARLRLLDRAADQQLRAWPQSGRRVAALDSRADCPGP